MNKYTKNMDEDTQNFILFALSVLLFVVVNYWIEFYILYKTVPQLPPNEIDDDRPSIIDNDLSD